MINASERQSDILSLIERSDISATMYNNANEKYHALASFLDECGIDADIYPQGSFAFGTVVRPSSKDPNAAYDLDFICQIKITKDQIAPGELRQKIENALKSSDVYAARLHIYEECFTIEYADCNGIGFTIDIVPATDETFLRKQELQSMSPRPDLINTSIAIPSFDKQKGYSWFTNNPRGFLQWFDEINQPFLNYNRESRRQRLFKENRMIFDSVESIPKGLERSAMQRVIQILKYHRDIYYLNLKGKDGDAIKPISAIINTIVAAICQSADPRSDVFDLLRHVLNELTIYASHQKLNYDQFAEMYGIRSVITRSRDDHKWVIKNPADPEDNLADKWNENPDIPAYFFLWIAACYQDLIQSLELQDSQFRTAMDNAFGSTTIQENWADKYKAIARATPKPIVTAPKPYRRK